MEEEKRVWRMRVFYSLMTIQVLIWGVLPFIGFWVLFIWMYFTLQF